MSTSRSLKVWLSTLLRHRSIVFAELNVGMMMESFGIALTLIPATKLRSVPSVFLVPSTDRLCAHPVVSCHFLSRTALVQLPDCGNHLRFSVTGILHEF